jgi:hypothetical protein
VRRTDWEPRLLAWAQARLGDGFRWGETDCAILAFEAYDALTGRRLAEQYRRKYRDARSALRFQLAHDVNTRMVLRRAGCVEVDPRFAQRGDVLIAPRDGFFCGHVNFGVRVLSTAPGAPVGWGETAALLKAPGLLAMRVPL